MNHSEYFSNRGTVRSYTTDTISLDDIKQMLGDASHAPNTGNMQWYSVIVTQDTEAKQRLAPAHFNQPSVTGAAAVLTFCIDLRRFEHWCRLSESIPGFDNFQSFVAAIIDTTIFAQQFVTIAEMNGYGTCYLGTTTYNAPQIAEALALPSRVIPVTTITVGIPVQQASPSWRLPVDMIVHSEQYHEASDAAVHEAYATLEADPMSARFIAENNKKTLAQVFTDVRYPADSAEYFSKIYYDMLAENGFTKH